MMPQLTPTHVRSARLSGTGHRGRIPRRVRRGDEGPRYGELQRGARRQAAAQRDITSDDSLPATRGERGRAG